MSRKRKIPLGLIFFIVNLTILGIMFVSYQGMNSRIESTVLAEQKLSRQFAVELIAKAARQNIITGDYTGAKRIFQNALKNPEIVMVDFDSRDNGGNLCVDKTGDCYKTTATSEPIQVDLHYDAERALPVGTVRVSFKDTPFALLKKISGIVVAGLIFILLAFNVLLGGFIRSIKNQFYEHTLAVRMMTKGKVPVIKRPLFIEQEKFNEAMSDLKSLLDDYKKKIATTVESESLVKIAQQVAHDIRSPLAALTMATSHLQELPEDTRLLVRSAVQRIHDIANDLAGKKAKFSENNESSSKAEPSLQLLSGIVDTLVSEKRLQYRAKINIEIDAQLDKFSYGLFAKIQPIEFKRVLSNLINNAVEVLPNGGKVSVNLRAEGDAVIIQVSDTGQGIPPEILSRLMQRGETHGKVGGSGLGLYHARVSVEGWGGRMEIASTIGQGTTVTITLPKHAAPNWFVPELRISPQSTVVILDDDNSIHQIWKGRFESTDPAHAIKLVHVSTPQELATWHQEKIGTAAKTIFLCDYEFIGCAQNGLDIIRQLNIAENAILVTSRFEEDLVRRGCEELGVRLIPKNLAGFVPICLEPCALGPAENLILAQSDLPDAVLIDDDALVHMNWKMTAKRKNKILRVYAGPEEFWKESASFPKNTPIYVDSNLGNGVKGEDVTWLMGKKGYGNLFLATGTNADQFQDMPWLKGIVGKGPPWG